MISSQVIWGNDIKASEYNNLRTDMPSAGFIAMYGGSSAPSGWLICDGTGLDTTTYATLFAIIGYTFGGSGSTFNLPDLRDTMPIGKSGTKAIGATGGSYSITLVTANLPSHSHTIDTESDTHDHNISYSSGISSSARLGRRQGDLANGIAKDSGIDVNHDHGGSTGVTGSGSAITAVPPHQVINYIIKY